MGRLARAIKALRQSDTEAEAREHLRRYWTPPYGIRELREPLEKIADRLESIDRKTRNPRVRWVKCEHPEQEE